MEGEGGEIQILTFIEAFNQLLMLLSVKRFYLLTFFRLDVMLETETLVCFREILSDGKCSMISKYLQIII